MIRTELERVTPESVGISSKSIDKLITELEQTGTEMHGLMIIRHGKVAAEGWWTPYAPDMIHSLHSLTKTYAATAVCLAVDEGLVKLEDRIIDLFPEHAPDVISDNLSQLSVRDVLCMGCGMDSMPSPSENWIRDFLATPVEHKPGTAFMYNSVGSNMLGAIVQKVSGLGLHEFLKPRLFDKIGIDSERFQWVYLKDGLEVGGGGGFSTTEDNARLMMLYLQNGIWNGEQVLSNEMVTLATTLQNLSNTNIEGIPDCQLGYGYQIWMCRPDGVYRADGAFGQYSIVFPEQDMIVAINETATYPDVVQQVLDVVYDVLLPEVMEHALPKNEDDYNELKQRLSTLSLPKPTSAPYSSLAPQISGKQFRIKEGDIPWLAEFNMMTGEDVEKVKSFSIDTSKKRYTLHFLTEYNSYTLTVALDGSREINTVATNKPYTKVAVNGWWEKENELYINVKWIETCIEKHIVFKFDEKANAVDCMTENKLVGIFSTAPVYAVANT